MNSSLSETYTRALDFVGGTVIHIHILRLFILFAVLTVTICWSVRKKN